jgi:putative endonuclease
MGRASERRGRFAETAAIFYLRCKLYRVLARRMRNAAGEIDLIVRSLDGILCFVEVKARPDAARAAEALGYEQRGRIARAAALYLAKNRALGHKAVRFDVLYVVPGRLPRHLKNAWQLD